MKSKINQKINDLLGKIAEIKPLQNFLDSFSNYQFKDQKNKQIHPKIYLVGGAVRDILLNHEFKDFDFVVEGLSKEMVKKFLESIPGKLMDIEGRNFGVFKLKLEDCDLEFIDIALPRIDVYREYGKGHKDVEVKTHELLTINDDLSRRDFTINAMAIDLTERKIIDPFGGTKDLQEKTIKAVGNPFDRLVQEDPTRMLRALRFAAKYDFEIEKNTFDVICKYHTEINRQFTQEHVDKKGTTKIRQIERVSKDIISSEFIKGFYFNPFRMIELLDESMVYLEIFPTEITRVWDAMKTTDQPKNFHSEGSVWNHTMLSLQNISKIAHNELSGLPKETTINLKLAVWLHDFGKVDTCKIDSEGNFTYYNHPQVSGKLADKLFSQMNINAMFSENSIYRVNVSHVVFAIENHMLPFGPDVEGMKNNTIVKYYLDITSTDDYEFGQTKPVISLSQKGIEVLQVAFVDANSSIKEHGPQDFTGLQRMINKILAVKANLELYEVRTKYPIDGHDLMATFGRISKEKGLHQFQKYANTGGVFFGDLLDYILEDALQNPTIYKEKINLEKHLDQIVRQYIMTNKSIN